MVLEGIGRADHQETLGPGEALERDAKALAHDAARTLRADEEAPVDTLGAAAALDDRGHAALPHLDPGERAGEADLGGGAGLQPVEEHAVELVLLALDPVGMLRLRSQDAEIELREAA